MKVIQGKLKGAGRSCRSARRPQSADVVDLMARLRASLEGKSKAAARIEGRPKAPRASQARKKAGAAKATSGACGRDAREALGGKSTRRGYWLGGRSIRCALTVDRPSVVEWYRRNRARSRAIFDLIDPAAYYSRPIALRNPIVFYEGHLPGLQHHLVDAARARRPAGRRAAREAVRARDRSG